MKPYQVSVIIPTLNERENIQLLLSKIARSLRGAYYEVIVVDDQSTDGTGEAVKTYQKKFKNLQLIIPENPGGLGNAILVGIRASRGEIIIGMDADFNHPPELLPQLITGLRSADLVVASRFIQGGGMQNRSRYLGTLLFNLFLKHFLGFPIMDNMSGYYAIKRKTLNQLPLQTIYQGYGEYHLRLVYLAKKKSLRIKEIPVYYPERRYGQSKSNLPRMFFQYLGTVARLAWRADET